MPRPAKNFPRMSARRSSLQGQPMDGNVVFRAGGIAKPAKLFSNLTHGRVLHARAVGEDAKSAAARRRRSPNPIRRDGSNSETTRSRERDIKQHWSGFNLGCSSYKACRLQEERWHEKLSYTSAALRLMTVPYPSIPSTIDFCGRPRSS